MIVLEVYSNLIGLVGVGLVLLVYLLLQTNKISQKELSFSLFNTIGSMLILVSLCFHFNLASFVIEISWLLISIFGVLRCLMSSSKVSDL